ncbi:LD-carboxypeptidase [Capnocytophaga sp. ARDL2]|uniref:S66 peptidase family protein n=1 Tax=Capnocytophaga sp. ARDL2 TaxID=3238809 RepID=UPI0035587EA5
MIQPAFLKKGDKVAIVCTARSFSVEEAQAGIELFQSWGLEVVLGKTVGQNNYQLAGTDKERADDFQAMLNDPSIKAIWMARGGYGSVRIVDQIDFSVFAQSPKWIIGFSDITVWHSHLHTLGFQTLHAIMPYSVPNATPEAKETLRKALFGEKMQIEAPCHPLNIQGKVKGTLIGGNLSIIYSLLATPSEINYHDKILFVEDLCEALYHVDRMFYSLKRSGKLQQIKGLIVGGMTDMSYNEIPFNNTVEEIIYHHTKDIGIPLCFDFPAGHIPDNRALVFGKEVKLYVDKQNTLLLQ